MKAALLAGSAYFAVLFGAGTAFGLARVSDDVVARCLLSEVIRLFKATRSNDDIAAELIAATDNLDDDTPLVFMRP